VSDSQDPRKNRGKEPPEVPIGAKAVRLAGLTCRTFVLELDQSGVGRGAGGGMFRLTVTDTKGEYYLLESVPVKDNADLIRILLHRIADKGGEGGWMFDADWYAESKEKNRCTRSAEYRPEPDMAAGVHRGEGDGRVRPRSGERSATRREELKGSSMGNSTLGSLHPVSAQGAADVSAAAR
jgi:hypothetical protein